MTLSARSLLIEFHELGIEESGCLRSWSGPWQCGAKEAAGVGFHTAALRQKGLIGARAGTLCITQSPSLACCACGAVYNAMWGSARLPGALCGDQTSHAVHRRTSTCCKHSVPTQMTRRRAPAVMVVAGTARHPGCRALRHLVASQTPTCSPRLVSAGSAASPSARATRRRATRTFMRCLACRTSAGWPPTRR